jgi:hypothetical protein
MIIVKTSSVQPGPGITEGVLEIKSLNSLYQKKIMYNIPLIYPQFRVAGCSAVECSSHYG